MKNQRLQLVTLVSLTCGWAGPATAAEPAPPSPPADNPVAAIKLAWTEEIKWARSPGSATLRPGSVPPSTSIFDVELLTGHITRTSLAAMRFVAAVAGGREDGTA